MKSNDIKCSSVSKLMILWIITIFFDSYYIFCIKDFPVTIFIVFSFIVFFYHILLIIKNGKIKLNFSHKVSLYMIIYLILNYMFTGMQNITSMFLAVFFFITYIITNRTDSEESIQKYIKTFNICMNIMAFYGIYQFVARIYNLPFSDILIEGHMVKGFNWTNNINIFGRSFLRSNAIFREPSFFSQYLAINIIILFSKILIQNQKKISTLAMAVINIFALILSFSGTGLIVLFIGLVLYMFRINKSKAVRKRIIFIVLAIIIGSLLILNSSIGDYFLKRASELFTYDENNYSGYVRFRSGSDVLDAAWRENLFIGIGIGTVDEFMNNMSNYYLGMTINGFYRPAVELGLIGIILWLIYIISLFVKKSENQYLLVIQCVIIPLVICHEAFLSNYYWILIYILNFTTLKCDNKKKIGDSNEKREYSDNIG